jgi:ribosomal protein L33
VANLGDSFKYFNTGAIVDKKGYVVSQNASAWEIFGKAMGFHPSRAQMQMDWMMADSQEQAYMQMIKTEAVRRAVGARLEGDADTERAVKEYIQDWNEATKGTRLEIRNFNKSVSQAFREAKQPLALRYLKSSAKSGRAEAKEIMRASGVDEETLAGLPD